MTLAVNDDLQIPGAELHFTFSRSSGPGGQNVNKVETMAEAWWHVSDSAVFTTEEKELISRKLARRINKDGFLRVKCSETRSQLENKQIAQHKFEELVAASLVEPKKRKATKPSKAAKEKRLDSKKRESVKKKKKKNDWNE